MLHCAKLARWAIAEVLTVKGPRRFANVLNRRLGGNDTAGACSTRSPSDKVLGPPQTLSPSCSINSSFVHQRSWQKCAPDLGDHLQFQSLLISMRCDHRSSNEKVSLLIYAY